MKNTLGDLNNHLFAQLERLGDEEIKGDKLTEEIERAKAVTQVSTQIISNGKLMLDAIKAKEEYLSGNKKMPPMLRDSFLNSTEE
ncbi:MAG: hypothetical protein ACYC4E_01855 [Carboxydocellales bacterium]